MIQRQEQILEMLYEKGSICFPDFPTEGLAFQDLMTNGFIAMKIGADLKEWYSLTEEGKRAVLMMGAKTESPKKAFLPVNNQARRLEAQIDIREEDYQILYSIINKQKISWDDLFTQMARYCVENLDKSVLSETGNPDLFKNKNQTNEQG